MKMVNYARNCSSQCPWCAKDFFNWLKSRMVQMDKPSRSNRNGGKPMVESFSQAAATSVRAK